MWRSDGGEEARRPHQRLRVRRAGGRARGRHRPGEREDRGVRRPGCLARGRADLREPPVARLDRPAGRAARELDGGVMTKGLLIVLSETAEGADEEEFNRWYSEVHAPEMVERGAAVSFRRLK